MSAHLDEAERAAEDGGPRVYVRSSAMGQNIDRVEHIQDAVIITPSFSGRYENDALGHEPPGMLADRIIRSAQAWGIRYKGQRLPYVPRQGPVQKTPAQVRDEAFEHELEQLCEKYQIDLAGDYYINAKENT